MNKEKGAFAPPMKFTQILSFAKGDEAKEDNLQKHIESLHSFDLRNIRNNKLGLQNSLIWDFALLSQWDRPVLLSHFLPAISSELQPHLSSWLHQNNEINNILLNLKRRTSSILDQFQSLLKGNQ